MRIGIVRGGSVEGGRALLTRRVETRGVGQVVPGGVSGRSSLSWRVQVLGRLALFQRIGWEPGDDLAYVGGCQAAVSRESQPET